MEVKKDILWRVYICFIAIVAIGIAIISKAFYIQQVQGSAWRNTSDSLHTHIEQIPAERGTIYSEDGQMLSTSIPRFDVYIDFQADGLIADKGKLFYDNVDSLSICLANLFHDRSAESYKVILKKGFNSKPVQRYFSLKKKVSFDEYQQMKEFPLVRAGKNKSGFIAEVQNIRLTPYNLLAFRTIGLERPNAQKVGLEHTYDTILKGTTGERLVRYLSGGISMPVNEEYEIEPENGKDIYTTLDTRIQDITENALMKMMTGNEAEHGCAVVMEVKTGKIKAIANLGRQADGSYWEDFNYAMTPTEPGSTFKLATMLSVLEDTRLSLNSTVDLNGGTWVINRRTVYDSEKHNKYNVSIKRAFELSSNVGMAKLAYSTYSSNPGKFINHLKTLHFTNTTGIDLYGERKPVVFAPGNKYWSATTLPWMAFGYNLAITPLHTAMLYNAVANNGKMMQPYLLNEVRKDGQSLRYIEPKIIMDSVCKESTLKALQECLIGVCADSGATAFKLFKGTTYSVAGKTGTALVANGSHGYADHIYQSSFAGYFPADHPQYTCVVVIKNKPNAKVFYGASVAGPVFKEIADRLVTMNASDSMHQPQQTDTSYFRYAGLHNDMQLMLEKMNVVYKDKSATDWAAVNGRNTNAEVQSIAYVNNTMPVLKGMSLKDALYICENMGLNVNIEGEGKVTTQSIISGTIIKKGQSVNLELKL